MDLVKEEGFWEIDEEDKKLDFEVYPHMVEQLIWKIKEAQEKTPKRIAAREDFDELIQRIQKLAKVWLIPGHFKVEGSSNLEILFRKRSKLEKDTNKIISLTKWKEKKETTFQLDFKVKFLEWLKLQDLKIKVCWPTYIFSFTTYALPRELALIFQF